MTRIAAITILIVSGCRAPATSVEAPAPIATTAAATPATSPAAATPLDEDEELCARGEPKPFLDASRVKDHRFEPGVGPRAEESATLPDGRTVRIGHLGCAHYVETFRFVLAGETEIRPAARAAELLRSLPARWLRAKDVEFWTEKLDAYAKANPGPATSAEVGLVEGFSWIRVQTRPVAGGTELEIVYDIAL